MLASLTCMCVELLSVLFVRHDTRACGANTPVNWFAANRLEPCYGQNLDSDVKGARTQRRNREALRSCLAADHATPPLYPPKDLFPVIRDSFIAWVPLNTINFYFTPPQFRVVFLSAAQACWLVYLSLVQHKR